MRKGKKKQTPGEYVLRSMEQIHDEGMAVLADQDKRDVFFSGASVALWAVREVLKSSGESDKSKPPKEITTSELVNMAHQFMGDAVIEASRLHVKGGK